MFDKLNFLVTFTNKGKYVFNKLKIYILCEQFRDNNLSFLKIALRPQAL